MTSGWRPWQTDRETPRELAAQHQSLPDQHAVDDVRVTPVTNRETPRELTASCHLRGEDAKISTLRAELFASTRVPNIPPLTRGGNDSKVIRNQMYGLVKKHSHPRGAESDAE